LERGFADTACVVKLYRIEPNSPVVRMLLGSLSEVLIAQITPLEIRSAFAGLVRLGIISISDAAMYVNDFLADLIDYTVVPLDELVLFHAERLVNSYGVSHRLRPLDSIQLASALVAHQIEPLDALVTTDNSLSAVAHLEGLVVRP